MANEVAVAARFEIEVRDLAYQHRDGAPLLARLYRPIGAGPFPALIDVHGGAWASGDRLNNAPLDEALAKSGIVVLAIDFRMPPLWRYPASIADVNLATRWLKAHAQEFGSRPELVGGLGTSSGGHQLLLSVLRPDEPSYAALPLAEAHDAYWPSEAAMAEGNPQLILEGGAAAALPPAIVVQGTGDDNVTPDMADRFASAYRAQGGRLALHKFAGQPHTFIMRDPASDASRQATELIRDFVLEQARQPSPP